MKVERRRRSSGFRLLRRWCFLMSVAVVAAGSCAVWILSMDTPSTTPSPVHPLIRRDVAIRTLPPHTEHAVVDQARSTDTTARGAFVHVGKTGGSTISVLLRHGCHSFMPHPCRAEIPHESVASRAISTYYHVPDFGQLASPPHPPHSFYVVTCRDPLDRFISAFVFEHVRNRYARNETVDPHKIKKYETAYECFPTLQRFVDLLGDDPHHFSYPHKQNWVSSDSCPDLAKAAIHSRVKIYNHVYFSYQTLLQLIPSIDQQTLYAIRQEHLWSDWSSLNTVLGQSSESVYIPPNADNGMIRNMTWLTLPVTRTLDVPGRTRLCRALQAEYRAYFWLLLRAHNLVPHTVQDSIEAARRACPNLDLHAMIARVSP